MKRGGPSHPKLEQLGDLLDLRPREVVGIVELLHHFTDQYAYRGDVGRFSNRVIAKRCDWDGDGADLVDAMLRAGILDAHPVHRLVVHDWPDHAPEYTKKKIKAGVGWAVDDEPPPQTGAKPASEPPQPVDAEVAPPRPDDSGDPPEDSGRSPEKSGLPRQGKAGQAKPEPGQATGGDEPPDKPPPRTRARKRTAAAQSPAPESLDDEQRAALIDWLERRGWGWYRSQLQVSVTKCLAHFRSTGQLRASWYATVQKWVTGDIERLDDPQHAALRAQIVERSRKAREVAQLESDMAAAGEEGDGSATSTEPAADGELPWLRMTDLGPTPPEEAA